jgi:predicted PurR-regulated permease PerM
MSLNPVAILIALALFAWMWGVFGAVIAVPLLVVIKVFCDHIPSLAVVGDFLSGERPSLESSENGNGSGAGQKPG